MKRQSRSVHQKAAMQEGASTYSYWVKHGALDAVMLAHAKRTLGLLEGMNTVRDKVSNDRLREMRMDLRRIISLQGGWK